MNNNNANIYPINQYGLEELENMRKKVINRIIFGIVLMIASLVAYSIMFYPQNVDVNQTSFTQGIYLIIVVGIILIIVTTHSPNKKYIKVFKGTFVKNALDSVFQDVVFNSEYGLYRDTIAATHMIRMGNVYSSNDFVTGKYKGIIFEQSDVNIVEETRDSEGHTTRSTLFKGRWMIFDFNKKFKKNIQVIEKGFTNAVTNTWFSTDKYKSVKLEDAFFNKSFSVYAQEEVEAFYILTPPIMEAIKRLKDNIDGSLLLGFVDNHLHVGVQSGKDAFEPSIFKKIDPAKVQQQILKDINVITQFIDELDLNKDIFMMGE